MSSLDSCSIKAQVGNSGEDLFIPLFSFEAEEVITGAKTGEKTGLGGQWRGYSGFVLADEKELSPAAETRRDHLHKIASLKPADLIPTDDRAQ
jgi:hypothetical protein